MSSSCKKIKMSLNIISSSKKHKVYESDDDYSEIFKNIRVFFDDRKFCDVTLTTVGDDVKVEAHRMILAASSEYFLAMFGGSLKEAEATEVKFDQIDGQTLKTIIRFIYTNLIELEIDTVENIIKAAHLFQLKKLEIACCDYLIKQLEVCNCLGIALFAEKYNYTTLYENSIAFVLENFMEVRRTEEFFLLSVEQLRKLLSNDKLRVSSEELVFYSLMSWIEYDKANREMFIGELIPHVRLTLLQPKFIAGVVEQAYSEPSECKLISKAYKWHLLPKFTQSLLPEEQIKLRNLKDVVIAISGWDHKERVLSVGLYYSQSDDWIYRECPVPFKERNGFGSTTIDNKLIIAGGRDSSGEILSRVDCLDLSTLKWTQLPSLGKKRYSFEMITLNGAVYAVGGNDGVNNLNSMEKWNPLLEDWEYMAPMSTSSSNHHVGIRGNLLCVSLDCTGTTYPFGTEQRKRLETYNPQTNSWENTCTFRDNSLIKMGTVTVNDVEHFITISAIEIKSVNLKTNVVTTIPANSDVLNKTKGVFKREHVILYNETTFVECNPLENVFKTMPPINPINGRGNIILIAN